MFWVIIIVAIIAIGLESIPGKIVAGASVLAIGLLLLRWITGITLMVSLAKTCAVVIVVVIVATVLLALFG